MKTMMDTYRQLMSHLLGGAVATLDTGLGTSADWAEREGFEPSRRLPPYAISSRAR